MKYIQKFIQDIIGPGCSACPDIEKLTAESIIKKHPSVPHEIINQLLSWCRNGQGCPDIDIGSIIEICTEYCFDNKLISHDILEVTEPYGVVICKYLTECSIFDRFIDLNSIVIECQWRTPFNYNHYNNDEEKEIDNIKAALQILSDEGIVSQSGDLYFIL